MADFRRAKITTEFLVPTWQMCNKFAGYKASKELCKFCKKTKYGHECVLLDETLLAEEGLVHKAPRCIKMSAGYDTEHVEFVPDVNPQTLIMDSIKDFMRVRNKLRSKGYSLSAAESAAMKEVLE